jgi:hypothetical protein
MRERNKLRLSESSLDTAQFHPNYKTFRWEFGDCMMFGRRIPAAASAKKQNNSDRGFSRIFADLKFRNPRSCF